MKMRDFSPRSSYYRVNRITFKLVFKSQYKVELQIENTNCKYCRLFFQMSYYSTCNC